MGRRSDRGVLSFAYFSLDKQRKVRRPRFGNRKLIYYTRLDSRAARDNQRTAKQKNNLNHQKQRMIALSRDSTLQPSNSPKQPHHRLRIVDVAVRRAYERFGQRHPVDFEQLVFLSRGGRWR